MSYRTLVELLEVSCSQYAKNDAFGVKQASGRYQYYSYAEFHQMVDEARAGLASLGISRGDRVAIVAENSLEWAVLCFATLGLGAAWVPMYEAQRPEEWSYILEDSGSSLVFANRPEIVAQLREFLPSLPQLRRVIALHEGVDSPDSYEKLRKLGRERPVPWVQVDPEDLAALIYTSGTTGHPKGVQLSHHNYATNVRGVADRFPLDPGDRSLAFLPWAHAFGQTCELFTMFQFGATIAINDEVKSLLDNLLIVKPKLLIAVPRIWNRVYDNVQKQMSGRPALIKNLFRDAIKASTKKRAGQRLSLVEKLNLELAEKLIFRKIRQKLGGNLEFVVSGSAALNLEVARFIDALGIELYEGYGLTETSPVISCNARGLKKTGSAGKPLPGVTVEIDHEATLDPSQGEIIVRGPNVMMGYYGKAQQEESGRSEDGSFRTGDMGYLDAEGYLFITGRIKEQYKLENGRYVVPSPLEEELKLSPYIANIMLYGENKPYNVALVVPDPQGLKELAQRFDLPERFGQLESGLTSTTPVREFFLKEIERYAQSFKSYEKPKDLLFAREDFTTDNGKLTPKLSLKRKVVLAEYRDELDELYP